MSASLKRYLVLGFGWAFVVLGVLGLFLPVLQGILFLCVGFILLSKESAWAQRRLERLKERYPKFGDKYDRAEAIADKWWRKLTGKADG